MAEEDDIEDKVEDHGDGHHHEEASDEGHGDAHHDDGHHAEEPATTYAGLGFVELFIFLGFLGSFLLSHFGL